MKVMKVIFFEKHKGNVEAKLSHWERKIPDPVQHFENIFCYYSFE